MGDNPNDDKNEESPIGAGSQWERDEVGSVLHDIGRPADRPPPQTVEEMMTMMFNRLFSVR